MKLDYEGFSSSITTGSLACGGGLPPRRSASSPWGFPATNNNSTVTMLRPTRLKITDLNPHLTCILCGGYFVDATTIIECLHSFCKSCIVKYLDGNKYCPICDVQVHKTKPLLNIRADKTLQDIVYKLVPGLFQNEMKRRRDFYKTHPDAGLSGPTSQEDRGEVADQRVIYTPDEFISLSLEYGYGTNQLPETDPNFQEANDKATENGTSRRFLRCPAAISVSHLKKFVGMKYGLSPLLEVDIMYQDESLYDEYTLMDIAYIYAWRRIGPLRLFFQVNRKTCKRLKTSHPETAVSSNPTPEAPTGSLPESEPMEVDTPAPVLTPAINVTPISQPINNPPQETDYLCPMHSKSVQQANGINGDNQTVPVVKEVLLQKKSISELNGDNQGLPTTNFVENPPPPSAVAAISVPPKTVPSIVIAPTVTIPTMTLVASPPTKTKNKEHKQKKSQKSKDKSSSKHRESPKSKELLRIKEFLKMQEMPKIKESHKKEKSKEKKESQKIRDVLKMNETTFKVKEVPKLKVAPKIKDIPKPKEATKVAEVSTTKELGITISKIKEGPKFKEMPKLKDNHKTKDIYTFTDFPQKTKDSSKPDSYKNKEHHKKDSHKAKERKKDKEAHKQKKMAAAAAASLAAMSSPENSKSMDSALSSPTLKSPEVPIEQSAIASPVVHKSPLPITTLVIPGFTVSTSKNSVSKSLPSSPIYSSLTLPDANALSPRANEPSPKEPNRPASTPAAVSLEPPKARANNIDRKTDKDDDPETPDEADSGRGSDSSSRAEMRSSCDDDIGSPVPAMATTSKQTEPDKGSVTSPPPPVASPNLAEPPMAAVATTTAAPPSPSVFRPPPLHLSPSTHQQVHSHPMYHPSSSPHHSKSSKQKVKSPQHHPVVPPMIVSPKSTPPVVIATSDRKRKEPAFNSPPPRPERDDIGALDLSCSNRQDRPQHGHHSRPRHMVANPPVLDNKHRLVTCLTAPKYPSYKIIGPPPPISSSSSSTNNSSSSSSSTGLYKKSVSHRCKTLTVINPDPTRIVIKNLDPRPSDHHGHHSHHNYHHHHRQ